MFREPDGRPCIVERPLDYIHPQRLQLPAPVSSAAARAALDPVLVRALGLAVTADQDGFDPAWLRLWLDNWQRMPKIACLLGAYLQWPFLAYGGASRYLTVSERAFAACEIGARDAEPLGDRLAPRLRIEAIGLAALLAWRPQLPLAFGRSLPLLFSPDLEALQWQFSRRPIDAALLVLGVQHARHG
jgi:type III secretion system OrgA/MxiK family protein